MRRLLPIALLALVSLALILRATRPAPHASEALAGGAGVAHEAHEASPASLGADEDGRRAEARTAVTSEDLTALAPRTGEKATTEAALATGTLVVAVRRPDGSPVGDVSLRVTEDDDLHARGRTDAAGLARFEALPPGTYDVAVIRGSSKRAVVKAGEEASVELVQKRCVTVHGVVVAPDGRAVAGADVYVLTWSKDWLATERVSVTDASGRFEVRDVAARNSLGAAARGFGPAPALDLEQVDLALGTDGRAAISLTLTLAALGGEVVGRVVDPRGAPVAGARVAVGAVDDEYGMRSDGTVAESYGARVAETDGAGRYTLVGLPSGAAPVAVAADGFPVARSTVEVLPGATTTHDVALTVGLHVAGTVEDSAGEVVPGALVIQLDAPFQDPFPSQGPTDRGAPFKRPRVRSAADGTYRLGPLAAGEVHLYAAKGTTAWDEEGAAFLGTAQATLSGADGATLGWDPTLALGRRIHGRVTYADGSPLREVFVSARAESDPQGRTERTRADGTFALTGLEDLAYTVSVQLWEQPASGKPLQLTDVRPSETPVLLVAEHSAPPKEQDGTVRVRLVDDGERVKGKCLVVFAKERTRHFPDTSDDGGVFTATLPPGRYRPLAISGDAVVGEGAEFDLAPGETLVLDDLHTVAAAAVVVDLVRGAVNGAVTLQLVRARGDGSQWTSLAAGATSHTFGDLLPGEYELSVWGSEVAQVNRSVSLRSGSREAVAVTLEAGVAREVLVHGAPASGWGSLDLRIVGATGELRCHQTYDEQWAGALPLRCSVVLPVGRFMVEARAASGRATTGELVFESLAQAQPLQLTLP